MATAEPTPPYTDEQLASDDISKKDIIICLQEVGSLQVHCDLRKQLKLTIIDYEIYTIYYKYNVLYMNCLIFGGYYSNSVSVCTISDHRNSQGLATSLLTLTSVTVHFKSA